MGELRDQIFLQYVNQGLDSVRSEFIQKHTPKKESRFLIKGITYEIGPCHIDNGDFVFEISSKIPQELLPKRTSIESYFKKVVRLMNKVGKKPAESKMENIIHNTKDLESKERDYVKLTYRYAEKELYTNADIDKRFKLHSEKKLPLPDIQGVATPGGKIIIALVGEAMENSSRQNVLDLVQANEDVKKTLPSAPAAAPAKPKAKAKAKPATKAKKKTAAKPATKKAAARKKPAAAKKAAKSTAKKTTSKKKKK